MFSLLHKVSKCQGFGIINLLLSSLTLKSLLRVSICNYWLGLVKIDDLHIFFFACFLRQTDVTLFLGLYTGEKKVFVIHD